MCRITGLEPDLFGITVEPKVGIGQQTHLVRTDAGNLLWDPVAYLDDDSVSRVRELGNVTAIAASHPHMFGVQVEWSRALGGVPVLVSQADVTWVQRPDPAIKTWSGRYEVAPGLTLHQVGGHFPGSSVVHWAAGAGGKGVLLVSDTIHANPDRATVTFLRSYPNRIPLSPAVVQRITAAVTQLRFDRLYDNFGKTIDAGAAAAVSRSGRALHRLGPRRLRSAHLKRATPRSFVRAGPAAGEVPAIALLAAVAGQLLAELGPVPECRTAGLSLCCEPALACTDLALARLARLLIGEPALDVSPTHDHLPSASCQPERTSLRISADRP